MDPLRLLELDDLLSVGPGPGVGTGSGTTVVAVDFFSDFLSLFLLYFSGTAEVKMLFCKVLADSVA